MVYYFRNPDIAPDLVEKYYVDESFYYDYDFISKPDETKWRKETLKFKGFEMTQRELEKMIKSYQQV